MTCLRALRKSLNERLQGRLCEIRNLFWLALSFSRNFTFCFPPPVITVGSEVRNEGVLHVNIHQRGDCNEFEIKRNRFVGPSTPHNFTEGQHNRNIPSLPARRVRVSPSRLLRVSGPPSHAWLSASVRCGGEGRCGAFCVCAALVIMGTRFRAGRWQIPDLRRSYTGEFVGV